jgi:hypothetical protein
VPLNSSKQRRLPISTSSQWESSSGLRVQKKARRHSARIPARDPTPAATAGNQDPRRLAEIQRADFADFDIATMFVACEMGTAKFEPEKSDRMAKFTPITFPLALNTGPPEPPEVVCAS